MRKQPDTFVQEQKHTCVLKPLLLSVEYRVFSDVPFHSESSAGEIVGEGLDFLHRYAQWQG